MAVKAGEADTEEKVEQEGTWQQKEAEIRRKWSHQLQTQISGEGTRNHIFIHHAQNKGPKTTPNLLGLLGTGKCLTSERRMLRRKKRKQTKVKS